MTPQQRPTNLINTSVDITLDGRVLTVRFRAFALIEYKKRLKRDLMGDIADLVPKAQKLAAVSKEIAEAENIGELAMDTGLSELLERLCDILWIGALDLQPDILATDIQRMIGIADIQRVTTELMLAFVPTLPPPPPPGTKVNPTEASLTSNGSSSNGVASESVAASSSQSSSN